MSLKEALIGPVLYSAYASTLQEVILDSIDLHSSVDDHAYKND